MDALPLEIIARIFDIVSCPDDHGDLLSRRSSKPRYACLALVSKQWRVVVESRIYNAIQVKSTSIETFAQVFGGRLGIERRPYLSELVLVWAPPSRSEKRWRARSRAERAGEKRWNNEDFSVAVRDLFTTLSSWHFDEKRDRPITLCICLEGPLPEPVRLLASDTIPKVERITIFKLDNTNIRMGSLPLIASKLPRLQMCHWTCFNNNEPLNSIRARRDRYEFAKHLPMLESSSIHQAYFSISTDTPLNENPETPSLFLPGHTIDHLSQSLHKFSQLESLSILDIHDAVISPALFWPSETGIPTPYWPNLTILRVTVNRMAADGGWYFEQNPHVTPDSDDDRPSFDPNWQSMPPTPERVYAEEEALARTTDFSDDSVLSSTESETESEQGAIYNTAHTFRAWPSPKMETLLQSMAQAVTRMPALKFFAAGFEMPYPHSIEFEFFYLSPGEQQDLDEPEYGTRFEINDIAKPRLFWRVPRFWRMSERVEKLWKDTLGNESIIEYQEWVLGRYRSEVFREANKTAD